jgi:hypothetical protein
VIRTESRASVHSATAAMPLERVVALAVVSGWPRFHGRCDGTRWRWPRLPADIAAALVQSAALQTMARISRAVIGVAVVLALSAYGQAAQSVPSDRFAVVNGVKLHFVDWGGTGEPLFTPLCQLTTIAKSCGVYREQRAK